MNEYYNAVETMFSHKKKMLIIGLTGRTGSGCSKVAEILSKEFNELDIKTPKTYDYLDTEERKYQVIYKYMSDNNWKKFIVIEGSAVIISFILERKYDELIKFLNTNHTTGLCKLDNQKAVNDELLLLRTIFDEAKKYTLNNSDNISEALENNNDDFFMYYTDKLLQFKKMLKDVLEKHVCYIKSNKGEDGKAQLYTYLMQVWGNNIRSSGDPYNNEFMQTKYFSVSERMGRIIDIIKYHEKESDSVRICIDALRNPYEAIYFKDNYEAFRLFSIATEDEYRDKRLSHLSKKERETLDKIESPLKFDKTEDQFYHQNIQACVEISDVHLYNPDVNNKKYYFLTEQLLKYISLMLHPGLVTPTHLERCMQLAYNAKFNSGCLSRQVGAVITGEDFSVRAVGWNDVPKGQVPCNLRNVEAYCENKDIETFSDYELCDPDFEQCMNRVRNVVNKINCGGRLFSYCFKDVYNGYRNGTNQALTRSLHAEENAFLQISKYGGSGIQGGYLFTTASPCELCAKKAYQLGITNIFYIDPYPGISMKHILKFGTKNNPRMNLFYGAIGTAYISMYEPRMAMKDELELLTGIEVKKIVKNITQNHINEQVASNISYDEVEIRLRYISNADIRSKRKVKFKVMDTPINHIQREIVWTGSKYNGTNLVENNNGYMIEDTERTTSPYSYKVIFNKNVMKDETVEYTAETLMSDEKKEMQPFLSHTVKNPTKKLTIILEVPSEVVDEVKYGVFRDAGREILVGGKIDLQTNEKLDGDYDVYCQEILDPQLLNTYAIEWKFL